MVLSKDAIVRMTMKNSTLHGQKCNTMNGLKSVHALAQTAVFANGFVMTFEKTKNTQKKIFGAMKWRDPLRYIGDDGSLEEQIERAGKWYEFLEEFVVNDKGQSLPQQLKGNGIWKVLENQSMKWIRDIVRNARGGIAARKLAGTASIVLAELCNKCRAPLETLAKFTMELSKVNNLETVNLMNFEKATETSVGALIVHVNRRYGKNVVGLVKAPAMPIDAYVKAIKQSIVDALNESAVDMCRDVFVTGTAILQEYKSPTDVAKKCPDACSSDSVKEVQLFKHQVGAIEQIEPRSKNNRLLVHHRVGSGKSQTALQILNSFYYDPRPKLVICPSKELCSQFFKKTLMASSNSPYTQFFNSIGGTDFTLEKLNRLAESTGTKYKYEKNVLQGPDDMIGFVPITEYASVSCMPAPLYILTSYQAEQMLESPTFRKDGIVQRRAGLSVFERGCIHADQTFDPWPPNYMTGKIAIFDESHLLITDKPVRKVLTEQGKVEDKVYDFKKIRTDIKNAKNSRFVFVTATLPPDKEDRDQLTDTMSKGNVNQFTGLGSNLFAELVPRIPELITVDQSNATLPSNLRPSFKNSPHYANVTYPAAMRGKYMQTIISNIETYAPKIHRVCTDLINNTERVLIAANESCGIDVMKAVLRNNLKPFFYISGTGNVLIFDENGKKTKMQYEKFVVKWKSIICESVVIPWIILIDTDFVAEGLDLPGITSVFSLSVYRDLSHMEQTFGRADRMCTPVKKLHMRQYMIPGRENSIKTMIDEWSKRVKHQIQLR